MNHKRIKKKFFFLLTLFLILFFETILFIRYSKKSLYFNRIAQAQINQQIKSSLNNSLFQQIKYQDLKLINTTTDKDGNILYVDYDIRKTYLIIENLTKAINDNIGELKKITIRIPYNINQNLVFYNIGPKITLKINTINSIVINTESKVVNYGLNNAMVNLYLNININYDILSGIKKDSISYKYPVLISSYVITGKVPSFYGETLSTTSQLFDIPIK